MSIFVDPTLPDDTRTMAPAEIAALIVPIYVTEGCPGSGNAALDKMHLRQNIAEVIHRERQP